MNEPGEGRLEALEKRVDLLSRAIARLEQKLEHTGAAGQPAPDPMSRPQPQPIPPQQPPPQQPPQTFQFPYDQRPAPPAQPPPPPPGTPPWMQQQPLAPPPAAPPVPPRPAKVPGKPVSVQFEELLGGRLLAWAGGVAVLIGVAFFVAVAISRGWIDEQTRIALAFAGSALLGIAGVWLHERKQKTQASMAMVGTSIAALYMTLVAATQNYHLFGSVESLAIAFVIGFAATAIAVRWDSEIIAALGIVGALLSPILVGAGGEGGSTVFVLVAVAASAGVLVWKRWSWLAMVAFVVAAPQILWWAFDSAATADLLIALSIFWALGVVGALGHELRDKDTSLNDGSAFLLAGSAMAAAVGFFAIHDGSKLEGELWLAGIAAAQLGVGLAGLRSPRMSREAAYLSIALGVLLGDLALGYLVEGPALAAVWAAGALPFVLLGRDDASGLAMRRVALVWQLALGLGRILAVDATPQQLDGGAADMVGGAIALGFVAIMYLGCARLVGEKEHTLRAGLDVAGIAGLAYLAAFLFDGAILVAIWSAGAVAVGLIGKRFDYDELRFGAPALIVAAAIHVLAFDATPASLNGTPADLLEGVVAILAVAAASFATARLLPDSPRELRWLLDGFGLAALAYGAAYAFADNEVVVAWSAIAIAVVFIAERYKFEAAFAGAICLLGLATAHILALEAPPDALVYGVADARDALSALAALALATFVCARSTIVPDSRWRLVLQAFAAGTAVYLVSVEIIDLFQPDSGSELIGSGLDTEVRQRGQAILSGFWSVLGLGALVFGLTRDSRPLRMGGFVLLTLAIGKVFLYDLSTLDSLYRVLSFVGLGLLLLVGALAYQQIKPRRDQTDLSNQRNDSP